MSTTSGEPQDHASIIQTDDGSYTVRHPVLGEPYHAHEGAASEAEGKFIAPTRLRERLQTGSVRLLDIGFGLGVNCRSALHCDAPHGIHIDTIEWEVEALDRALLIAPEDPLILGLKEHGAVDGVSLHLGDLRKVLPILSGPYDVIFHDPFSPLKNTEAWTVEVFKLLYTLAGPNTVLATYSESKVVRSAMSDAGWLVGSSPSVPPQRGGSLAATNRKVLEQPLQPSSFYTEPYRDPTLSWDGKKIRSQREATLRSKGHN